MDISDLLSWVVSRAFEVIGDLSPFLGVLLALKITLSFGHNIILYVKKARI